MNMKKTYSKPETIQVVLKMQSLMNLGSLHDEYNKDDVTYGRGNDMGWDDED